MTASSLVWAGFALCFLAAVVLSLFHISLASFSKISMSRFLENREKAFRTRTLDDFDETQLSVEYLRDVVIIGFVVFLAVLFPRVRLWPLWFFLVAAAVYSVVFGFLPHLINALAKNRVMKIFLPAFPLVNILGAPFAAITRSLVEREEQREEKRDEREATEDEIETFIDEATEEGIIEKGEDELLRSVVEFGDIVVREIMTPRVNMVAIRKDATIDKLKDLIIREKYSRIPVFKDRIDNIEGVVMAKDMLEYSDEKHKVQPIEALIRTVGFVPESMPLPDLLAELQKVKQKMAIAVDEHGSVSGLVTMEDVVEQIVGEIQDEYDTEEAQIVENAPDDYTVSGATEVEELEELFDVELAEDDFVTVGGLVTSELGRLPVKGQTLKIKGLVVDILDVDEKKIKKLRIRRALTETREGGEGK